MPNVQVLHDRFEDDPHVSVLAVQYDDRRGIADYMAEQGYTFRLVPEGSDVWDRCDVVRFPTLLMIAPDGQVIYNHRGRMTDAIRDEMIKVAMEARVAGG